jgi:hypothetical protein
MKFQILYLHTLGGIPAYFNGRVLKPMKHYGKSNDIRAKSLVQIRDEHRRHRENSPTPAPGLLGPSYLTVRIFG